MPSTYPCAWGNYTLLEPMASGGMADIYLALQGRDLRISRLVVIKKIRHGFSKDKSWLEMFKNEAQSLLCLQSPNIIQTYDVFLDSPEPYLVLEYVEGLTLKDIFSSLQIRKQKIPYTIILEIIKQCAEALSVAHNFVDPKSGKAHGIIHRDVSPHNVILSKQGYVKLIDFGIAKSSLVDTFTEKGNVKGKAAYMSPEQFLGKNLDGRSDLFSLGIIAWELASEQRLFQVKDSDKGIPLENYIRGEFPLKSSSEFLDTPREVFDLILKLLEIDLEKRFESAAQFVEAVFQYQVREQLPHGHNFLAQYIRSTFSDELNDEKERVSQLQDATAVGIESAETVLDNVTFKAPQSKKYFLSATVLALALFVGLASYWITVRAGFLSRKPAVSVETLDLRQILQGLSAKNRDSLKSFHVWTRSESFSDNVQIHEAWKKATQFQSKYISGNPLMDSFGRLSEDERLSLFRRLDEFRSEFESARGAEARVKLIQKYTPELSLLPPPRKMAPSSQEE